MASGRRSAGVASIISRVAPNVAIARPSLSAMDVLNSRDHGGGSVADFAAFSRERLGDAPGSLRKARIRARQAQMRRSRRAEMAADPEKSPPLL